MTAKTLRGIDEDLWRKARAEAVRRGQTIGEFISRAIERELKEGMNDALALPRRD